MQITTNSLYQSMLNEPHLLIAGATGSGKSVVENALIYNALLNPPGEGEDSVNFILIDPKRVELVQYKDLPHCLYYASEHDTMYKALRGAMRIIDYRYKLMAEQRKRKYTGGHIYVVIDEFADLMTTDRKRVSPLVQRIAQVGRAAKVHLIICTQCPICKVIPTEIKVNFDARLGLRTRSAQDSVNILGVRGCETLPRYGYGYYMTPEGLQRYELQMVPDSDIEKLIRHWIDVFNSYGKC